MGLNWLRRLCIPGIYTRVRPNIIASHVTMNLIGNFPGKLARWFWRCNWMYDLPSCAVANFQYPGPGSATITNRSQPSDTKRKRKEKILTRAKQVQYSNIKYNTANSNGNIQDRNGHLPDLFKNPILRYAVCLPKPEIFAWSEVTCSCLFVYGED